METAEEAPLCIGNVRSVKADKPIVAIGIEGSANKVNIRYLLLLCRSIVYCVPLCTLRSRDRCTGWYGVIPQCCSSVGMLA